VTATCALTVLHSVNGRHAAKRFSRDKIGAIRNRSYDNEKHFRIEEIALDGFEALASALTRLTAEPHAFVIRGAPLPNVNRWHARRLLYRDPKTGEEATFRAVPRHWFAADMDHIHCPAATDPVTDPEGAVEYLIGLLPPELADASAWWQWTSSQSLPGHEGLLSARLWFWAETAVDDAALKRWAAAANQDAKIIDAALYSGAQAHYTAAPLFGDGLVDPLPRRFGLRRGLEDAVSLIIPPPDHKNPEMPGGRGYEPGPGVEAYLAKIGGAEGFREPIKSAIASYVAIYGGKADVEPLKKAIRAAITRADPGGRAAADIKRYASDQHLDKIIDWVRQQHGDQPPKRPRIGRWRDELIVNPKTDRVLSLEINAMIAMRGHPDMAGLFGLDEFHQRALLLRAPPWGRPSDNFPRPVCDADLSDLLAWLQQQDIHLHGRSPVRIALASVVRDRLFHPVRNYLLALRWDGTKRLDNWLTYYLGVEPIENYTTEAGRLWMISAVARIFQPGCIAKYVLVIEGDQDLGKSTALCILGGEWFTDDIATLGSKDAQMQVGNAWIIELAELDSTRRADISAIKAFISRSVDQFRPPYGEHLIRQERQSVLAATVNPSGAYLHDETGAVRFWPVKATCIDLEALARDRDQLWAEAVALYQAGTRWWPGDNFAPQEQQEARSETAASEPWLDSVLRWLELRSEVALSHEKAGNWEAADNLRVFSAAEVLSGAIEIPKERQDRRAERRLGTILRRLGYVSRVVRISVRDDKRTVVVRRWTLKPTAPGLI
jgi:hypothetical protein